MKVNNIQTQYHKLMPSKNAIKEYEAGAYYHIYNRGVEERTIFQDDQDYKTFLSYLKIYLTAPNLQGLSLKEDSISPSRQPKNYSDSVCLLAFCLMPNHFHLLIKQNDDHSISYFMSSVLTKYVRYFNTRHKRIGHLFQGRYKAVKIENEYQWIHLSKYIHRNPLDLSTFKDSPCKLEEYKYSSFQNYLGLIAQSWVHPDEIIANFGDRRHNSYQNFVTEDLDISPIYFSAIDYD